MCNIRTSRAAATCAFVVGAIAIGATGVLAHSGASGIVRERMDAMIALSDHMKAVGVMLKGEAELDRNIVEISASQIVRLSDDLPGMFPEAACRAPARRAMRSGSSVTGSSG